MAPMLLIQKEKSSVQSRIGEFGGTDGDLTVIGSYCNGIRGLPWLPGSGNTRYRPSAEKVCAMTHLTTPCANNEVFA
jgi:hypothetical protein